MLILTAVGYERYMANVLLEKAHMMGDNMSFYIKFIKNDEIIVEEGGGPILIGEIRLGKYLETFESPLDFWAREDYQAQWKDALIHIRDIGIKSCLITSLYNPRTSNFLRWWVLYRKENDVIFQDQIFFFNRKNSFDLKDPYKSIRDHRSISPKGERVSEWVISVKEIMNYLNQ
jgi:hypothetical protein